MYAFLHTHKCIEHRFLRVSYILEISKCKQLFFHPPGDSETEALYTTAAVAALVKLDKTNQTLLPSQSPYVPNPGGQTGLLSEQALSHLTMIIYEV